MKLSNTFSKLVISSVIGFSSITIQAANLSKDTWLNPSIELDQHLSTSASIELNTMSDASFDLESIHRDIHARGLSQAMLASQQYSLNDEPASTIDASTSLEDSSLNNSTVAAITDAAYAGDLKSLESYAQSEAGYNKAYALYRLATLNFVSGDMPQLAAWLKQAEQALGDPKSSEEEVLLAAIIGMMMGVDSSNAMNLIVPHQNLLQKNSNAEFAKARVFLLQGVSAYHTPPSYGGGVDKAESLLRKALKAFEHNNKTLSAEQQLWGEAEAHVWLGKLYWNNGKRDLGQQHFDKAVKTNSKMAWVEFFKNDKAI